MDSSMNKRITHRVNYNEDNSENEEQNEISIAEEVVKDVINKDVINNLDIGPGPQLNKKKQYKKIYETTLSRGDWDIDYNKSLPKGNETKDCYYFYVNFHPGVYKILTRDVVKILNDDFNIKLKSGRPERFGDATVKSICNFKLRVEGEREKVLQLIFYHTNNSLDIKITGNPRNALEKFKDLRFRNGAVFFIEDVLPEVIKRLFRENDIETSKSFWSGLAKEGYFQEVNKEKEIIKRKQGTEMKINRNEKPKKCGHCQKMIGKKVALQCISCNNMNLVECLKDIELNRIEDFKMGHDKFYCSRCVSNVNPDSLSIEASDNTNETVNTLEELTCEVLEEPADSQSYKIEDLKAKIASCEFEMKFLKSKNKLLEETSNQLTSEYKKKFDLKDEVIEKLRKECNDLKKDVESKDNLISNLTTENSELGKEIGEIKAGKSVNEENSSEISKYKEFLKRTQSQCKELENKLKKAEDKHKAEMNQLSAQKQATEEKYGVIVREKKLFEEKERILFNTFKSMKQLSELKEKVEVNKSVKETNETGTDIQTVDITGEESNGGTSSLIIKCEKCNYKSTMKDRMKQHVIAKHEALNITCDHCEFVGNAENYLNHMKNTHSDSRSEFVAEQTRKDKGKQSYSKNAKAKNSNVVIPCDICSFVGKTALDYIKHIEEHNREKADNTLPCELCDYKAKSASTFKEHIEAVHGIKVNGTSKKDSFRTVDRKNHIKKKGFCVYWNRGHCNFDDRTCFYEHKNIPACRFQDRCYKSGCKFYHDVVGKFPFLELSKFSRNQYQNPEPLPFQGRF